MSQSPKPPDPLDHFSPEHLAMLRDGSAISPEVIAERGYYSEQNTGELAALGFAPRQRRPGLVIPLHATDGSTPFYVLRPDSPRQIQDRKTGKVKTCKYEVPKDQTTRIDCPPRCRPMLGDPAIRLWVTEGQKKGDSLASKGAVAIALLGVWNWKGPNSLGGVTFANDWDYIALAGREVVICFDSDVMLKREVRMAMDRLTDHLQRKGAVVKAAYLPGGEGSKVGVDDYFAGGGTLEGLEAFIDAPHPVIKQAPSFGNSLPSIDAEEKDLRVISGQAWAAIKQANDPASLFLHGDIPSRLELCNDSIVIRQLTPDRLRHEAARAANWYSIGGAGDKVAIEAEMPPLDVIRDMLAYRQIPLPNLLRVVEAPVFATDGALQVEPGYHATSKTYYQPCHSASIPDIPEKPTDDDVKAAKSLILDDLLGEFPFVSPSDKAHAVALLLLPFARDMIPGPTPNHLIEAPIAGSGKGLLADALLTPALGKGVTLMAEARDDDEWRKRLTSALREAKAAIMIDNVARPLESGVLAAAITAPIWTDRILGYSETISLPVRCAWVTTANNPTMSTEIARRCVRIRLDPKVDQPWMREGFNHPDLRAWTSDNRGPLIGAALTLIRSWIAAGRPRAQLKPLGSFETWSFTLGGILQHAGITGFLDNLQAFYEAADLEGAVWRQFAETWWAQFQGGEVGTKELFPLAVEQDNFDLGKGAERSQRTVFGKALGRQRDRVIGKYRVVRTGEKHQASKWCLLLTEVGETSGNIGNIDEHSYPQPVENMKTDSQFSPGDNTEKNIDSMTSEGGNVIQRSPCSPTFANDNGNGHKPFVPSPEWQEIPEGAAVPPGGEYRMDMTTGRNYARWPDPEASPVAEGEPSVEAF